MNNCIKCSLLCNIINFNDDESDKSDKSDELDESDGSDENDELYLPDYNTPLSIITINNTKYDCVYYDTPNNKKIKWIVPIINKKRHGQFISFWLNQKPYTICEFKNGKKYGKSTSYYKDGCLRLISYYFNDELNGVFEQFQNYNNLSYLLSRTYFINGIMNGTYTTYFIPDGKIKSTIQFINGRKKGKYIEYDRNNNIIEIIKY
jgi:antitoxin component YwqK of YwqJK toxin-antitoxin module